MRALALYRRTPRPRVTIMVFLRHTEFIAEFWVEGAKPWPSLFVKDLSCTRMLGNNGFLFHAAFDKDQITP